MCNFLSAIYTQDGRLLCNPLVDSHSDLIELFGVHERAGVGGIGQKFVKLELTPTENRYADVAAYSFRVDETETPGWFDKAASASAESEMRAVIEKMVVRGANGRLLVCGCFIVPEGVCRAKIARVFASGSATVEASGSATVEAYDSATVEASGSATVRAYDSATVRAYDSATVTPCNCGYAYCKPTIIDNRGGK